MYRVAYSIVFFVGTVAGCTSSPGADQKNKGGEESSPEEVLALWVGTWKGKDVIKPTKSNPKELTWEVSLECKWMLGRQFVEEFGEVPANNHKHRYIVGYDATKKVYRDWLFMSDGTTMQSTGSWDAQTKTMTWKADIGDGSTVVGKTHFIDADAYEWTALGRDKSGKVFLDMHAERRRVK